jgi:hypothetical protein
MQWNPGDYGELVADLLALAESGERLMPLAGGSCCSDEARKRLRNLSAEKLFPPARAPRAALSGLYLYFGCRDEAHEAAQSDPSVEGSYWHAIIHRQEPDAGNASYWFHQVGAHPVFPSLLEAGQRIAALHLEAGLKFLKAWNPFTFLDTCEEARRHPGSELEAAALEIQRAEWQLLFDYCARRSSG